MKFYDFQSGEVKTQIVFVGYEFGRLDGSIPGMLILLPKDATQRKQAQEQIAAFLQIRFVICHRHPANPAECRAGVKLENAVRQGEAEGDEKSFLDDLSLNDLKGCFDPEAVIRHFHRFTRRWNSARGGDSQEDGGNER